jgi:hypothetical protein
MISQSARPWLGGLDTSRGCWAGRRIAEKSNRRRTGQQIRLRHDPLQNAVACAQDKSR